MDLKSTYAYWPIKNGLIRAYPALNEDVTCDVAVIGGGITGALVAFHLAEAGIRTVVLDRRDIGWGSTSATTALLQYEIDTPLSELVGLVGEDHAVRSYKACLDAIYKLERLAQKMDEPCGFERKKSLYVASNKRDVKTLQAEHALRNQHGIGVDWLTQAQIEEQFGFNRPAALLSHDAAQVDAYRLTHQLLHKATQHGARVFDRTAVMKFEQMDGAVHLHTDPTHTVRAKKVAFATGYESQQYLKQQVAKLISTYAFVSEPVTHSDIWLNDCLMWESARPYIYMRTTEAEEGRRRIIMGGETEDGLAYIGETEEFPNAFFALGYGGNGITYSVVAAEIIRDAVLGRPNAQADLFRFDR